MRRSAAIVLAAAMTASRFAAAEESPLDKARSLYESSHLSKALGAYEAVLKEGGLDRAQLADVHLHLGILRAGARDREGAIAEFSALLSLDPEAKIDPRWSPRIAEAFRQAAGKRTTSQTLSLAIEAPDEVTAGVPYSGVIRVDGDPAHLATTVLFRLLDPPNVEPIEVEASGSFVFPPGLTRNAGKIAYWVSLLDVYGSTLATLGSESEPRNVTVVPRASPVAANAIPAALTSSIAVVPRRHEAPPERKIESVLPPPAEERSTILSSPWVWCGAAIAAILAGAAIGYLATPGGNVTIGPVKVEHQ